MALSQNQLLIARLWFETHFNSAINFIWTNLTPAQQTGLIAKIQADLGTDITGEQAALTAQQTLINNVTVSG